MSDTDDVVVIVVVTSPVPTGSAYFLMLGHVVVCSEVPAPVVARIGPPFDDVVLHIPAPVGSVPVHIVEPSRRGGCRGRQLPAGCGVHGRRGGGSVACSGGVLTHRRAIFMPEVSSCVVCSISRAAIAT